MALIINGVPTQARRTQPVIINGDMAVAQRSTSVTGHNSVAYTTVDRFKTVCEVGTFTVAQESLTSGNAYLAGFKNALRLDCTTAETSAGSAGDQTTVEQRIEGGNLQAWRKGTSSAQPFTLAFWVKSNKTGSNFQANLRDGDNSRQVGGVYSISSANTWEHKIINYPADTTGAFDDDDNASLTIEWFLDGGSNYSGGSVDTSWGANDNTDRNVTNFDIAGSTDNDWAITGVQLEVGTFSSTDIPPFQFENFGDNLERCSRYFQDYKTSNFRMWTTFIDGNTSDRLAGHMTYNTVMRDAPSVSKTNNTGTVESQTIRERGYSVFATNSSRGSTTNLEDLQFDAEI